MWLVVLRRLGLGIITLWVVSLLVFAASWYGARVGKTGQQGPGCMK